MEPRVGYVGGSAHSSSCLVPGSADASDSGGSRRNPGLMAPRVSDNESLEVSGANAIAAMVFLDTRNLKHDPSGG